MASVEQDIEKALTARLADLRNPFPEIASESFALRHMRSLAFGAAGAVVALAAILSFAGPRTPDALVDPIIVGSVPGPSRVPATPIWRTIQKPVELISLQAPQFGRHAPKYVARQSDAGDLEDALVFETGQPEMPDAKVALRRRDGGRPQPSLFIDMTRQLSERGIAVTRAGAPFRLTTKFGDIDAADMTIEDPQGRGLACLAFRSDGPIGLFGWYCAPQRAAAERPELVCFIDRLALLRAGEDRDLRGFFAEAEQRRRPCPTARVSTGRKPTWLDSDGKAPPMRGDITGGIERR